jgi:signal peptidase I
MFVKKLREHVKNFNKENYNIKEGIRLYYDVIRADDSGYELNNEEENLWEEFKIKIEDEGLV